MGAGIPTLRLMPCAKNPYGVGASDQNQAFNSIKFTPISLDRYLNVSSRQFGPREQARQAPALRTSSHDGLIRTPSGQQRFRGIPFLLGPDGVDEKAWLVVSNQDAFSAPAVEIPLHQKATFICLAAFCDWDKAEIPPSCAGPDVIENVGQQLAHIVLAYADGTETSLPLRRRFEVKSPRVIWGQYPFMAVPHLAPGPRSLQGPLTNAKDWGDLQTVMSDENGVLGICALQNPYPERSIKTLKLQADGNDPVVVCGLTLFHGVENPLRYERLKLYRITLPEPATNEADWRVETDLGIVARTYLLKKFDGEEWLGSDEEFLPATLDSRHLYAEVTASLEATLTLQDMKSDRSYNFDLGQVVSGKESQPRSGSQPTAQIEVLEPNKVWLHGRVLDEKKKEPTPVRISFRSKEGRYLPPYGHRTEVNEGWFQDYGADLALLPAGQRQMAEIGRSDSSFAYVDGTFQIELPVGEVYVEIEKGFEYEAVRRRLTVTPGQRELDLKISRMVDLRSAGWVSADTHVHFLSPSTALLEGQAEGLNLINLLAAQWGDLFTNVGDFAAGPLRSRDGDMLVQLGTENRQHMLGHLGLLGANTAVYPMSAAGPDESYLGDPLWTSMAEWADICRKRDGLAVATHFPYPTAEIAADIALGKIDAVEIVPAWEANKYFNNLRYLEWYRYLNCGYRLPAVSGTDKMSASTPAGETRAYVYLGQEEFTFANWAKAVRKGNTFVTSGPLLTLQVDGHVPGDEVNLPPGRATLEVQVQGKSFVPFHQLEVVVNGVRVASREDQNGTKEMLLKEKIQVTGPGWIAARCSSLLPRLGQSKMQAHTSPVYLVVTGKELFSAPVASYMLTLIDGAQAWAETLAVRPDPERFARVLKVFKDARAEVHRRLHQHGIKH